MPEDASIRFRLCFRTHPLCGLLSPSAPLRARCAVHTWGSMTVCQIHCACACACLQTCDFSVARLDAVSNMTRCCKIIAKSTCRCLQALTPSSWDDAGKVSRMEAMAPTRRVAVQGQLLLVVQHAHQRLAAARGPPQLKRLRHTASTDGNAALPPQETQPAHMPVQHLLNECRELGTACRRPGPPTAPPRRLCATCLADERAALPPQETHPASPYERKELQQCAGHRGRPHLEHLQQRIIEGTGDS